MMIWDEFVNQTASQLQYQNQRKIIVVCDMLFWMEIYKIGNR